MATWPRHEEYCCLCGRWNCEHVPALRKLRDQHNMTQDEYNRYMQQGAQAQQFHSGLAQLAGNHHGIVSSNHGSTTGTITVASGTVTVVTDPVPEKKPNKKLLLLTA